MVCNQNPVELADWRYSVDLGCGEDSWRLGGRVYGHPNFPNGYFIYVSTPKELDESRMLLTTASGRVYHLLNCDGNLEKNLQEIKEDIARGGTLRL